jgi:endoglucanase
MLLWTRNGCVAQPELKVDTVGYLPLRIKRATVPAEVTDVNFAIRDVATQEVAYSGELSATPLEVPDTGESVRIADFTALTTPGTYVLEIADHAPSPPFEITSTVYDDVLRSSLLGLYGQRCGSSVTIDYGGDTFAHGSCHPSDAAFDHSFTPMQSGTQNATGGWHDAGDYGKYTVNGAFSVAFLVKAWEDFGTPLTQVDHLAGTAGALPPILAEAKYQLDWLLKMQLSDGNVLHLVCPKEYPGDAIGPDADRIQRYFLQASSSATAYFAAAIAAASRVFRDFDAGYADQLLTAAQLAQGWLQANPEALAAPNGSSNDPYVAGGPYNVYGQGESAARVWARVELWRTTGDGDLAAIESSVASMSVAGSWDWAGVGNLAVFEYADASLPARDANTLAQVQTAITSTADTLTARAHDHGYGRALAPNDYNWGSNGMVARTVMTLWAAYRITPKPEYLDAAAQQVNYLLGRNPFGRSFVTGVGFAPPVNPHHRPSSADNNLVPWPGLLVGGPHKDANDPSATRNPDLPAGTFWFDASSNYYVNEIAINWNAALIYALAGFVP